MKLINLFLSTLLVMSLNAQVNVKGAETTKTISNQREVVFERKEIDVTKYVEESPSQRVVIVNEIKGAELVESSDDAVRIKISPRGADAGIDKEGGSIETAATPAEKKRIVIDLGEPTTVKKVESTTDAQSEAVAKETETKLAEAEKKALEAEEKEKLADEIAEAERKAKADLENAKLAEEKAEAERKAKIALKNAKLAEEARLAEENEKVAEQKAKVVEESKKVMEETVEATEEVLQTDAENALSTNQSTTNQVQQTTNSVSQNQVADEPYQDIFAQFENEYLLRDSSKLKNKNYDQQYNYENYLEAFPPRKKAKWTIGLHAGIPYIAGDIRPRLLNNIGGGLNIEKPFTPLFALRLQSIFAQMYGFHYNERPLVLGGESTYPNYKTRMTDHSLQAVFRLGNTNFYKRSPKVLFKLFGGLGVATSFTQRNLLDENGMPYDYSEIANVETFGDRRFVANQLNNLLSDNYETVVEPTSSEASIRNTRILPSLMFGMGMDFYLSKAVDLSLEARASRHFTDNLDGLISGSGEDWFIYLSAGLNFKIGKKREAVQWNNPLASSYDDLMTLKQNQDLDYIFQDLDGDGVPDYIDQDLNTPPGVRVDTKGVPMDSDGDGVPDYLDKEPFSPKGAEVDEFGVAIDSDKDGVPDIFDIEPNTPEGALTDVKGRQIKGGGGDAGAINNWSIFYDTDGFRIKNEYNAIINNVATYLALNPNVKVKLVGYADTRYTAEYNLQLSNRRVNEVGNRLKALGIDESRLESQAKGDTKAIVDVDNSKGALKHQLNRRVTITFLD